MEKNDLMKLINDGKTQREICCELNTSQTNLRYWLKKYDLKTLPRNKRIKIKPHLCKVCGETCPGKFYGDDKVICSKCHNERVKKLGKDKRRYAIDKLGGKCSNTGCNFDKYYSALDIHHLNPNIKDDNFKSMRGWSLSRIDNEIKNCVLLCRNCHAAYHSRELIINWVGSITG